jgi:hypothetical protein
MSDLACDNDDSDGEIQEKTVNKAVKRNTNKVRVSPAERRRPLIPLSNEDQEAFERPTDGLAVNEPKNAAQDHKVIADKKRVVIKSDEDKELTSSTQKKATNKNVVGAATDADEDEIKQRILTFLREAGDYVPTLDIAREIYGPKSTAKMVNPLLYRMLSLKLLQKQAEDNGAKPRWKVTSSGKTSTKHSLLPADNSESD